MGYNLATTNTDMYEIKIIYVVNNENFTKIHLWGRGSILVICQVIHDGSALLCFCMKAEMPLIRET